jgi:protease I
MSKKVAILVDNYFEQAEFEVPLRALRDNDVTVDIIATRQKDLTALQHTDKGDTFAADLLLQDADPPDYDALVLPGGVVNADKLRMDKKARHWVSNFLDANKPIAAICHAPWLLVSADGVEGRRLTSYYTLQDDIRNAGGEWADFPVLVDRNLITSRQPDDLPQFCDALLGALGLKTKAGAEKYKSFY